MYPWQTKQYKILENQKVKNIQVIKDGPRFFIASGVLNSLPIFFKSTIPHHFNLKYNIIKILKEATILKQLQGSNIPTLKHSCSQVINYHAGSSWAWYIKEFAGGQFQNLDHSNFLFKPTFFNQKKLNFLTDFLDKLSQFTHQLTQHTKIVKYLKTPDQYIDTLLKNFNWQPYRRYLAQTTIRKVTKFLIKHKKIIENSPKKLAHCEIYPSHLIKTKRGLKVIDWENLRLSNPARDACTIWIRAYQGPKWQKAFKQIFLANSRGVRNIQKIWDTEVLLQAIGDIGYFDFTEKPEEIAQKGKILNFLIQSINKTIKKH